MEGVLEEIRVTAQRREERLEDVPISVSTMDGDRLATILEGGEDIRALAGRVPGLNAESSNGRVAPRFYLRGLGNTDFDLAASQPVSIIMDEVVMENVILKSFPLFDIERVEVLRGPQGTLFGRNTPAGIIKFDTVKPSEELSGYFRATAGEVGTLNFEGALGGSLGGSDTVLGRLSVFSLNRDDWISNSFTGENDVMGENQDLAVRGQLLFQPSDEFSALVNVHWRDYEGTSEIFRANILTAGSNALNENFDRDVVAFNEGDNNPQTAEQTGVSLTLDWNMTDSVALTSITAYESAEDSSLGDIDGGNPGGPGFIPFQSVTRDGIPDLTQLTQEFRLSSQASDMLFWQAGFYYFDEDYKILTEPFFIPGTTRLHENTSWAVFGQFSYDMSASWNLTAGVRYTDDEKDLSDPSDNVGTPFDPVNVQDDEKIARRTAEDAGSSLARQPDLCIVINTRRDLHFFGYSALDNFLAAALGAGLGYDLSASVTLRTGRYIYKRTQNGLLHAPHFAAAAACRAGNWRCARFSTAAITAIACLRPAKFDIPFGTEHRLLERYL
ncbi:MAG: TonB-dependent receptor [Xanthomonadales bacterium]